MTKKIKPQKLRGMSYSCETRRLTFDWEEPGSTGQVLYKALGWVSNSPIANPENPNSAPGLVEADYDGELSGHMDDPGNEWPGPDTGRYYVYIWFIYASVYADDDPSNTCGEGGGE